MVDQSQQREDGETPTQKVEPYPPVRQDDACEVLPENATDEDAAEDKP